MWTVRPDPDVTRSWADAALDRAEPESTARIHALLARANLDPVSHAADAREASTLAERIGDVKLRSYALGARRDTAHVERRLTDAEALVERRLELLPEIGDPDHIAEAYEAAVPTITAVGRLDDARRLAGQHQELSSRLSTHHRVHGLAVESEIEDAAGNWEAIVARTPVVSDAVEANLATPCIRNARSLLLCAVAYLALGEEDRAREVERRANQLEGKGFELSLAPPRIRLALLRGDRTKVQRLVDMDVRLRERVFGPGVLAALLDGLAALRDRDRIEDEAPSLARSGLLLEPFALRALGVARDDDDLLARADERFAALGLDWHAAQTERLLAGL
jgi:hypothetical protein